MPDSNEAATPLSQRQMISKMSDRKAKGTVLLVIGIVALAFSLFFTSIFCGIGVFMKVRVKQTQEEFDAFQREGAVQTEGVIVDNSHSGDGSGTTVRYDAVGETYEVSYSVKNSSYQTGKVVTVYYSETNNAECMFPDLFIDTYYLFYKVFVIIGASVGGVFFIAGMIMLLISIRMRKRKKENLLYQ